MNLYKILFSHTAPKDTEVGIKCLLLAENDEQVYEWIKSEPKITQSDHLFNGWGDYETDYGVDFKNKIISIKGEMFDDEYDYSDAYYGIKLFGWELLKENITTDYSELMELGIIKNATCE
ncbi:hypothetical protein [uncultured Dysgonomonas sp.]|uniref:Uncharacterized protein n=1 Tax=uncultured Dysgonomonas sp. TaxID=206096 RepID=A0A212IXI5_9BACT|nr:hypothetical protein [uncultured Dysgonomonas sp.]SBV91953.1 conserved hypothetical protein [uncultured Dysgonomonas sp.]